MQDKTALISIIVPVYKVEKYLCRCIDSIIHQTYSNLEIILIDDGSPDSCPQICDEYAKKDTRIKVIHKKNEGAGVARNAGLKVFSGEYVMFVDSDDYLYENAVLSLYERLCLDDSDMVIGKHVDVYNNGDLNGDFCSFMCDTVLDRDALYSEMGRYSVSPWAKLYARKVIESIRYPSFKCAEDLFVFPEIISKCNKISILNDNVYYYFQNVESITHKREAASKRDEVDVLLYISNFLNKASFEQNAARYFSKAISKALLLENKSEGRNLFKHYFTRTERKQMLKRQNVKIRIRYILLYIPFVYSLFRILKKQ